MADGRLIPTERRLAGRSTAAPDERLRLLTGSVLVILNRSSRGALVEGNCRLVPGCRVEAHLVVGGTRALLRGLVVRSHVSLLGPGGIRYRAGLEFEDAVAVQPGGKRVPRYQRDDVPPG